MHLLKAVSERDLWCWEVVF